MINKNLTTNESNIYVHKEKNWNILKLKRKGRIDGVTRNKKEDSKIYCPLLTEFSIFLRKSYAIYIVILEYLDHKSSLNIKIIIDLFLVL